MNLYVHVPFCVSKCRYCAFHSETGASAEALAAFPRLIGREGALRAPGARPTTLYLGGGTPSILGADGLRALAAALPAFAPYATMDESDVKDCGSNRNADVAFDLADGSDAASAPPDAGEAMDAAAEADAAAKGTSTRQ